MQTEYDGFVAVKPPQEVIELKPFGSVAFKRILAFTPIYRIEPETAQAVLGQEWLAAYDVVFGRDNPHSVEDGGRANIHYQYQKARQLCLDGNYDALFIVESDVIPPKDALKRLAVLPSDVAYGEYLFRRVYRVEDDEELFNSSVYRFVVGPYPDEPLSLHADEWDSTWNTVTRCSGAGLGCVLIWRQVLEAVPFRIHETGHTDTEFTKDVWRAGYSMMADRAVRCGHKRPDGSILYPSPYRGHALIRQGITDGFRGELADDPTKR